MQNLRYPVGKFEYPSGFSQSDLEGWIQGISTFPMDFSEVALSLTPAQLSSPYRPGGWTGRQVIHHVSDSHLQAYSRFKLVLTEERPTIKPYFEDRWAELADTKDTPIAVSIDLLKALHQRWTILMRSMSRKDFDKSYIHPDYGKEYTLGAVCKLYDWHGRHHLAHLQLL